MDEVLGPIEWEELYQTALLVGHRDQLQLPGYPWFVGARSWIGFTIQYGATVS